MVLQKPPLIIKISSSLSNAIFDCGVYSNWQMDSAFNINCQAQNPAFSRNVARPYSCWL